MQCLDRLRSLDIASKPILITVIVHVSTFKLWSKHSMPDLSYTGSATEQLYSASTTTLHRYGRVHMACAKWLLT